MGVGPVVAGRLREEARAVFDRTALGVARTIIEPRDPGVGDRARAHRARFERHPQVATFEPVGAERLGGGANRADLGRSEEHTSDLQSLMRISYAVFCLTKKYQILLKLSKMHHTKHTQLQTTIQHSAYQTS